MKKVALLMSGGVDSSYCAYLLKEQGYEVLGVYLKLHRREELHTQNIRNIQKASEKLNINYTILEFQELFSKFVYEEFITSYKEGRTPNPCAICNPQMKFGFALQKALELGYPNIATGHYARIENGRIKEAYDKNKDQSYFLFGISQDAINRVIFPLGHSIKAEIKPTALEKLPWLGSLETYKDSQEICFVETNYIDILKKHYPVDTIGDIVDKKGNKIGQHQGYMQYTIGKRKGFRVDGAHTPHYVIGIHPQNNQITVGSKEDLAKNLVHAKPVSLPKDFKQIECSVKIRYRSPKIPATVFLNANGQLEARLKEKAYGVANGQALVLYDNDCIIGGGFISHSEIA
ncbi:tRNA 2-thiouridine(34) synthase MnmA [Helicobacter monodelphidis]|nr:tRNA 2-thiouridine(34) synthase MnmA [Helicobacter sp. 15-1451]